MRITNDAFDDTDRLEEAPPFRALIKELHSGLGLYWETADQILTSYGVTLKPPGDEAFSFQKNFFSRLFLYSYQRAGIPCSRRRLYAATLQCLRGMVTGCDNLLDDEYKPTLDTDIPAAGHRFRSVVDIMVSDRVLFQILWDAAVRREIGMEQVAMAATASMKTMPRSGIEEAGEEAGIETILAPELVLQTIHHFKTGILFQCPWDIPLTIEPMAARDLGPLLDGLYRIGLGCQIMDDMVDLGADIRARKHNYLVSLVHHGSSALEKNELARAMDSYRNGQSEAMLVSHFPGAVAQALQTSRRLLTEGLVALFAPEHHGLVQSGVRFLAKRIGVDHLTSGIKA